MQYSSAVSLRPADLCPQLLEYQRHVVGVGFCTTHQTWDLVGHHNGVQIVFTSTKRLDCRFKARESSLLGQGVDHIEDLTERRTPVGQRTYRSKYLLISLALIFAWALPYVPALPPCVLDQWPVRLL